MGTIVLAACASHSPGITGFPERAAATANAAVDAAFSELARTIGALAPDAIVTVSAEHFTNFSLANLPTFAVAAAPWFAMPASESFASFLRIPPRRYPGHQALGEALFAHVVAAGFDPSFVAGGYGFDEGFAVPLALLCGERPVPVVPVVVNGLHAPFPSLARCHALGQALADGIVGQDLAKRVVVIGTGGLSHWVGLPRAGEIDAAFDGRVLASFAGGRAEELCSLGDADLDRAGNGAHELRAWMVAAGAAGNVPWRVLAYEPVPAWLTGTAVAVAEEPLHEEGVR
jgi:protocatechuate 4,5-dioxygenase beta chain/2,3-dihydroxyphenylpropionate 1,2-dioxygenase